MRYKLKGKRITQSHIENKKKLLVLLIFACSFVLFGLVVDTPENILLGMKKIILDRDTLITDYIQVGGIGAAFVNSGLLTLIFIYMLYRMKININGVSYAAIFSITGFALFGKNIFNVWFVIIGVYLYAKFQKEKFSRYVYIALFGTAMAPIATEFIFAEYLPWYTGLFLGIFLGILIGFIIAPLSTHLLKMHQGYNLYNIGFTAGLVSTVVVSILKSYGYIPNRRLIYSEGNNFLFSVFLMSLFIIMIIIGFIGNNKSFKNYLKIWTYTGRLVTDYITLEGLNLTLINMGLTGLISTSYVLLVGGELSGPTIGGILVVVGFSAFGKHPKNILPIFLGVYLGALTKIWDINNPSIILAALFGTSLAPIAGEFGIIIGALAAYIHLSVTLSVVSLHGGLNLYNNGFSAGLVATFLVPIIDAFRRDESSET
ncbi:DUF1576 domain-containing protein [Mycoplasmatota bacterium]|nr:DUF1576 domain-containing protein [Mycoplasmatota bacterium]